MQATSAHFKDAFPYKDDKMNLPVHDVEAAIPFYETVMGFKLISKENSPRNKAILGRDDIEIGLCENGGDPTQEGCVFEVDNIENAFAELTERGLKKEISAINTEVHGKTKWRAFYVMAPDGLCYFIGEKQV